MAELTTFRLRLRDILTSSLRNRLERELDERCRNALRVLASKAARHEPELAARLPASCPWSFEQVVGDFFPEPAPARSAEPAVGRP